MIIGVQSVLTKLKAFVDSFTRGDNASSLAGATSPTSRWQAIRGTWGISSNRASSSTGAGSYPLAGIKTGAKSARVKVSNPVSGTCGYGLAFWILDSSNWYGAHSDRTYVQTSYQYSYECSFSYMGCGCPGSGGYNNCGENGGNPCCTAPLWGGDPGHACGNCNCGGCTTAYCGTVGSGCSCTPGTVASINYNGNGMIECAYCGTCGPRTLCSGTTTCTGTGYTDNYTYYVYLVRMHAGSMSTLHSMNLGTTTSNSNNIPYIQVETNKTSINNVRLTAQRDSNAATVADVAVTSPVQTGMHGLLIGPRWTGTNQSTQSSTVDEFDYNPQ